MLSDDDLIDIIADVLAKKKAPAPGQDWRGERPAFGGPPAEAPKRAGKWGFHAGRTFNAPWTSLPMKRPFISEYAARQLAQKGQKTVRIPKAAILSPLAEEWLQSRGIAVVRED